MKKFNGRAASHFGIGFRCILSMAQDEIIIRVIPLG
jgi:hypothetical protein